MGTSTGNRIVFKIGGKVIGLCQSASISDDPSMQVVDGIGDLEAVEFVPGMLSHRISGDKYFADADTLTSLGFIPKGVAWLVAPEFTVEVIDKVSGLTVESYTGCKFGSHSRRYSKHTITGESFEIMARHQA